MAFVTEVSHRKHKQNKDLNLLKNSLVSKTVAPRSRSNQIVKNHNFNQKEINDRISKNTRTQSGESSDAITSPRQGRFNEQRRKTTDRYVLQYPTIFPDRIQVRSFTSLTPLPIYDDVTDDQDCDVSTAFDDDMAALTNQSLTMEPVVDSALRAVKEGRKMRLKDKLSGVSKTRFIDTLKGEYEIYNDDYDINKLIKHELPILSRQSTFSQLEKLKYAERKSKLPKTTRLMCATFPPAKPGPVSRHVSVPGIGVNWSFPPASPQFSDDRDTASEGSGGSSRIDSGRLYRNSYPVTEALHKEGVSVTMSMGRALTPGDVNIFKVWPRRLDEKMLMSLDPVFIAKQDTAHLPAKPHTNPKGTPSSPFRSP